MEQDRLIGKRIMDFVVTEKIADGDKGAVYKCQQTTGDHTETRALKAFRIPTKQQYENLMKACAGDAEQMKTHLGSMLATIEAEIDTLSKLSEKGSRYIVRYYDHTVEKAEDGFYDIYIQMEYLQTLDVFVERQRSFSVDAVVLMGLNVLNALRQCHNNGVVHRDIRPDNIFLTGKGEYKIGGFGLAGVVENVWSDATEDHGKGSNDPIWGKDGSGSWTAAEDLYELALILFRLLDHGRGPQPYADRPQRPELGGEHIGEVLERAVGPVKDRFHTAEGLTEALRMALVNTAPEHLVINVKDGSWQSFEVTEERSREAKEDFEEITGQGVRDLGREAVPGAPVPEPSSVYAGPSVGAGSLARPMSHQEQERSVFEGPAPMQSIAYGDSGSAQDGEVETEPRPTDPDASDQSSMPEHLEENVAPPRAGAIPAYPTQAGTAGYPPQSTGYPPQPGAVGYPPQAGAAGYPPQSTGCPPQPGAAAYPPQAGTAGYPPQSTVYPPQPGAVGYPPLSAGYPPQAGAVGYPPQSHPADQDASTNFWASHPDQGHSSDQSVPHSVGSDLGGEAPAPPPVYPAANKKKNSSALAIIFGLIGLALIGVAIFFIVKLTANIGQDAIDRSHDRPAPLVVEQMDTPAAPGEAGGPPVSVKGEHKQAPVVKELPLVTSIPTPILKLPDVKQIALTCSDPYFKQLKIKIFSAKTLYGEEEDPYVAVENDGDRSVALMFTRTDIPKDDLKSYVGTLIPLGPHCVHIVRLDIRGLKDLKNKIDIAVDIKDVNIFQDLSNKIPCTFEMKGDEQFVYVANRSGQDVNYLPVMADLLLFKDGKLLCVTSAYFSIKGREVWKNGETMRSENLYLDDLGEPFNEVVVIPEVMTQLK